MCSANLEGVVDVVLANRWGQIDVRRMGLFFLIFQNFDLRV